MLLINSEFNVIVLTWSSTCVISNSTITDTKLYVPVNFINSV